MKLERSECEGRHKLKIFNSIDDDYGPSDGCVLAVGNFDGVHKGHQLIFKAAVKRARDRGLKAVLLTFTQHPAAILRPKEAPHPLMTVSDRLHIAESFGFDTAFVLDFDPEMAALSPGKFVEDVLVRRLGVRAVVAGESWRFGYGREGDMAMLEVFGRRRGFEVHIVHPLIVDSRPVSSTRIRRALAAGDVASADALLGRPHFIRGKVVRGKGRGRELGFPTVNLECFHTMVPGEGVYAGGYRTWGTAAAMVEGKPCPDAKTVDGPAAVSIGASPTFENGSYQVEAHLVGWEGDLYGAVVIIAFLEKIRRQSKFPGWADLANQISLDVNVSKDLYDVNILDEIPCWIPGP